MTFETGLGEDSREYDLQERFNLHLEWAMFQAA